MNVILTGEKQIGKSTALDRFLAACSGSVAGFRTVFDSRSNIQNRRLLLCPLPDGAAEPAVTWTDGKPQALLSVFDRRVPPLLAQNADLYVLDELGKFETGAAEMRRAVEALFESEADVLAVVRLDAPDWMGALKCRPDVTVLTVTAENRDRIPALLRAYFANAK